MSSVIYRTPPILMDAKRAKRIRVGDKVGIVCGDLGIVRVAPEGRGTMGTVIASPTYTNAETSPGVAPSMRLLRWGRCLAFGWRQTLHRKQHSAVSSNPAGGFHSARSDLSAAGPPQPTPLPAFAIHAHPDAQMYAHTQEAMQKAETVPAGPSPVRVTSSSVVDIPKPTTRARRLDQLSPPGIGQGLPASGVRGREKSGQILFGVGDILTPSIVGSSHRGPGRRPQSNPGSGPGSQQPPGEPAHARSPGDPRRGEVRLE